MIAFLTSMLIGGRFDAVLLGLMGLIAWSRAPRGESSLDRYKSITWGLFAASAPPLLLPYTLKLIDRPLPVLVSRLTLTVGTLLFCACMIAMLATRALIAGISLRRVRLGLLANSAVLAAFEVVTWLVR